MDNSRHKRMSKTVTQKSRNDLQKSAREVINCETTKAVDEPEIEQSYPLEFEGREHTPHYSMLDSFYKDVKKMESKYGRQLREKLPVIQQMVEEKAHARAKSYGETLKGSMVVVTPQEGEGNYATAALGSVVNMTPAEKVL